MVSEDKEEGLFIAMASKQLRMDILNCLINLSKERRFLHENPRD